MFWSAVITLTGNSKVNACYGRQWNNPAAFPFWVSSKQKLEAMTSLKLIGCFPSECNFVLSSVCSFITREVW